MTQAEFAKILNVNQSQISKWEAEDYNFTVEKLSEIATALDLYLDISFKKEIPLCSNQEKSCIWLQFPSGPWAVKSHKGFESEYERQEM